MSKVLVAFATRTGCTEGIAEHIGKTLSEAGLEADVVPAAAGPDPSRYDAVFLGSGARAGNWHGPAKKWMRSNAEVLKTKPLALFTCGLTMAAEPEKADEVRGYTDSLLEETGLEPIDIGLFAGWFVPEKFSLVGRTILNKMDAKQGDFRDWEAIAAWTREILPELHLS
jgi:menaquinone-dependent protoporphyrinogen oxidase